MTEERRAPDQLIEHLDAAVGDLKLTVTELRVTLASMVIRDVEDRGASAKIDSRVSSLEVWRGRIQGQIALLALTVGGTLSLLIARILGFNL
jgi:hypothetical protein